MRDACGQPVVVKGPDGELHALYRYDAKNAIAALHLLGKMEGMFIEHRDAPLGALDAFTRMRMQDEVLRLWQNRRTTMLLVTHDIDEAIYMSDRIIILTQRPGTIEQIIPIALDRPRDRSNTDFLSLRSEILELLHFAGNRSSQVTA